MPGNDKGQSDEHRHDGEVLIIVDGAERSVERKGWVVSALKAELGIEAAKVLAEITPHGLKDLDDGATIHPHDRQRFMTHARSGGSS